MIAALAFGFVIGHVRDADKMAFYQIHESIGHPLELDRILGSGDAEPIASAPATR